MEYKVIPFTAQISKDDNGAVASKQLAKVIEQQVTEGWEYVALEDLTTNVAPDNGCFGFGAKPGFTTTVQCIVFCKH